MNSSEEISAYGLKRFFYVMKLGLTYNSNPKKDDFLNILHWLRQIFALIFGLIAGYYHLTGFPIVLIFMILNLGFVHFYTTKYINFEDEKVEQHEIYTEALMISFAVFAVSFFIYSK